VGWAGLVLTHSFTALMFAPFFLLYLVWSAWRRRRWRPLRQAVINLALAIGLTAFFWLPLGLEAQYVGLGGVDPTRGYRNHLVRLPDLMGPWLYDYATGEGRPDTYFAFGAVPAVLLLASMGVLIWSLTRSKGVKDRASNARNGTYLAAFGVVTCLLALFMVSRASIPLWDLLAPVLGRIQFPWRFLGISTLGVALAGAGIVQTVPGRVWRVAALGLIGAALLGTGLARLPFDKVLMAGDDVIPEQLWAVERETGQAGTTWGGEFLPVWVTEQRWALGRAPEASRDGLPVPVVAAHLMQRAGNGFVLAAESDSAWRFRLHAFYFPGWQVVVDGYPVSTGATGMMGLVTAEVPAGLHTVAVGFGYTGVRTAARWLTGMTLVLLPIALWWPVRSRRKRSIVVGWALLVILVTAGGIRPGPWPVTPLPLEARFGDEALLTGAEWAGAVHPGDTLPVTLYWLALREVSRNDKAFVHLVDAEGQVVAQHDGDPGGGFTPTTRWQSGELVPDRHYIEVPPSLAAGVYRLKAGLYQLDPFRNLLTEPLVPDGRVDLGEVIVR